MRLKELSAETGVSPASIKFYLREGLLHPGRKVNPTLASYDESHVARLHLIAALREVVGTPLERIKQLVRVIDDPAVPIESVMEQAQLIGLGEPPEEQADEPPSGWVQGVVSELIERRGWPDVPSRARQALLRHLTGMASLGLELPESLIEAYSSAAETAATAELGMTPPSSQRDVAAMMVAVGVHSYTRLLLRIVALAQASHTIRKYGGGQGGGEPAGPRPARPRL